MSILVLQDASGNIILVTYLLLSAFDHCVLESGKTHAAVAWSDIPAFIRSLVSPPKSTAASLALKSQNSDDLEANASSVAFDFSKNKTKLVYSGTKLSVSLCLALAYVVLFKLLFTLPFQKTKAKSTVLLATLILLSVYRDKHEKKIATTYEPQSLHIGRAFLTPLVYLNFTVLSLID